MKTEIENKKKLIQAASKEVQKKQGRTQKS